MERPNKSDDVDNMYVFEGTDYSVQPTNDDVTKFNALIAGNYVSYFRVEIWKPPDCQSILELQ